MAGGIWLRRFISALAFCALCAFCIKNMVQTHGSSDDVISYGVEVTATIDAEQGEDVEETTAGGGGRGRSWSRWRSAKRRREWWQRSVATAIEARRRLLHALPPACKLKRRWQLAEVRVAVTSCHRLGLAVREKPACE